MLRFFLVLFLMALPVSAHRASESFVTIKMQQRGPDVAQALLRMTDLSLRWDIALRDLDFLLDLDADSNASITGLEFKQAKSELIDYLFGKIALQASSKQAASRHHHHHHHHDSAHHQLKLKEWIGAYCKRADRVQLLVDDHSDGKFAVLIVDYVCERELDKLALDYGLLFAEDPEHRALVEINYQGKSQSYVLDKNHRHIKTKLGQVDYWQQFMSFLDQGKWHIWTGFDHILFLLALLLPVVMLTSRHCEAKPKQSSFKSLVWSVVKIVTCFTVAHSITLTLAALELVSLDAHMVEAIIALSIAIAALTNLWIASSRQVPLLAMTAEYSIAFVFGLIHGFGFAGALQDLGLPLGALLLSLFSFNLGVELGQLAIVIVFVPLTYVISDTWFYKNIVYRLGSVVILLLALKWFFERV
ncbi:MAG: HupE/UreJ family protein [Candidatus Melainabacteria bacterium]|nr:HupE/UreJ family protein [Candidatus Melainabacteria bacterium]